MHAQLDFEKFYSENWAVVVRALSAATGSSDLAEDLAADSFAHALVNWPRVRNMESPRGWLLSVAWTRLRRRRRRDSREALRADFEFSAACEDRPGDIAVWNAVRSLPPRQRTAIALRYVADLTERDVARIMGVRPGTVASHLSAARRALSSLLDPEISSHDGS